MQNNNSSHEEGTFKVRKLEISDKDKGFIQLLQQLTSCGSISDKEFEERFQELNSYGDNHLVCVIEDTHSGKIIASGSVFIEKKFIRNCGKVGHIEDVVVDSSARGMQLGKKIVAFLTNHARSMGCYKVILDCSTENRAFYEKCSFKQKEIQMVRFCRMECEDHKLKPEFERKIFQIFSDFMTRVAKFEELVSSGSKSLDGFRHGLEFLRRPPINKTSESIEQIFTANESRRVAAYVEAGCVSVHDRIQNISKLHTCQLGLLDHLTKAKSTVNELEGLVKEMTGAMQTANDSKAHFLQEAAIKNEPDLEPVISYKDEATSSCEPQKPEVIDYATMMGVIYSMVKQDFNMQEKIISSLNLKSSSGELESYNLMWSLRPFIDDEIMHQAWRLIP